jgi:hypothetical protein
VAGCQEQRLFEQEGIRWSPLDEPVYDQARAAFGTRGVADMLSLIGAYQTVCGILNAFEIPAPETSQPGSD